MADSCINRLWTSTCQLVSATVVVEEIHSLHAKKSVPLDHLMGLPTLCAAEQIEADDVVETMLCELSIVVPGRFGWLLSLLVLWAKEVHRMVFWSDADAAVLECLAAIDSRTSMQDCEFYSKQHVWMFVGKKTSVILEFVIEP